jgi:hypothetical protein
MRRAIEIPGYARRGVSHLCLKAFYEENPFPKYDGVEDFASLVNRGQKHEFTRSLLDEIGYNKLILECGCGTRQLTQFLIRVERRA